MLVDELGLDPGPRARRARAAAAAAGPVADAGRARARSAPSAPTAGCCRTTPRTPTRSSAARTTSRPACGGCGTRASWRWSGRPASASPRWSAPAWSPRWSAAGTPVLVTTPGAHPTGLARRAEAAGPADPGGGPGRGGGHRCARTPPSGSGTSPRWPPTWAPAGALVLSLRADHLGDLAPYPDIARVLEDGLYLLGPMSEPDLRSAIEGPARRAGLRLEPGLVDLLVREVEGEPAAPAAALPRAARDLGAPRGPDPDRRRATGPPAGSGTPSPSRPRRCTTPWTTPQRSRLRSLLLRLVMPTEDGDPVRARVPRAKVAADDAAPAARRAAGRRPAGQHRRRHASRSPTRRWCGSGRGCAAGSTTTSTGSASSGTWPAPPTPGTRMGRPDSELYRGARLARTAGVAGPGRPRPERHRDGLPRRLRRPRRGGAARRRGADRAGAQGQPPAARRPGRCRRLLVAGPGRRRPRRAQRRPGANRRTAPSTRPPWRRPAAPAPRRSTTSLATSLLLAARGPPARRRVAAGWENLASHADAAGPASADPACLWCRDSRRAVSVTASSDGALVAPATRAEGVQLFDAETMAPVPFGDDTPTSVIRFSPDGKLLAAAVNHWTGARRRGIVPLPVRLYDLPDGSCPIASSVVGRPEATSSTAGLQRDGSRLAAGVSSGTTMRTTGEERAPSWCGTWPAGGARLRGRRARRGHRRAEPGRRRVFTATPGERTAAGLRRRHRPPAPVGRTHHHRHLRRVRSRGQPGRVDARGRERVTGSDLLDTTTLTTTRLRPCGVTPGPVSSTPTTARCWSRRL